VYLNNFRNGRGEAVNWEVPIGGKTLNTPLQIINLHNATDKKKKSIIDLARYITAD